MGLAVLLLLIAILWGQEYTGKPGQAELLKIQIERAKEFEERLSKEIERVRERLANACKTLDTVNERLGGVAATGYTVLDTRDCVLYRAFKLEGFRGEIQTPVKIPPERVTEKASFLKEYGRAIGFFAGVLGTLWLLGGAAASAYRTRYEAALIQTLFAIILGFVTWMIVGS